MHLSGKDLPAKAMDDTSLVDRHDFGMVRPNDKLQHSFRLKNTSSTPWTFKLFHTSCLCTVTRPSAPCVAPGKEADVELVYRTESKNTDARHRVGVEFAEADAPFIWLEVQARVREPLSVFPEVLSFPRVGRGKSPEQSFEVHNYGDRDVGLGTIECMAPWLSAASFAVPITGGPNQPRQVWRVMVRAATDRLGSGRHVGHLQVRTDDSSLGAKLVSAELYLSALVEAVPAQMFFGGVEANKPATHKVLLRFAANAEPAEPADITLRHDLGDHLLLTCTRESPGNWTLAGTLNLNGEPAGAFMEGKIDVAFKNPELSSLELPVFARVRQP